MRGKVRDGGGSWIHIGTMSGLACDCRASRGGVLGLASRIEDRIRMTAEGRRLCKREFRIRENVLLVKNLSIFF